jgi:hypothetical protein
VSSAQQVSTCVAAPWQVQHAHTVSQHARYTFAAAQCAVQKFWVPGCHFLATVAYLPGDWSCDLRLVGMNIQLEVR